MSALSYEIGSPETGAMKIRFERTNEGDNDDDSD